MKNNNNNKTKNKTRSTFTCSKILYLLIIMYSNTFDNNTFYDISLYLPVLCNGVLKEVGSAVMNYPLREQQK